MRLSAEERNIYRTESLAGSNRSQARSHHWEVPKLSSKFHVEYKMKIFLILAAAVLMAAPLTVTAQSGAKLKPQIQRDAELEKDSLHNLEVARHYFKLRKAYV